MNQWHTLMLTPMDLRDSLWESELIKALRSAKVKIMNDEPLTGPDGWPYLYVRISDEGEESFANVIKWLYPRGIGLLIDHQDGQEYPDAVFSWGTLWWMYLHGDLPPEPNEEVQGPVEINWKAMAYVGQPRPEVFPQEARAVIREFLQQQNILQPKILAYSANGKDLEIAFSLESLGTPPEAEHLGILEALSWFFPTHFQLALVSEKNAPPFQPL